MATIKYSGSNYAETFCRELERMSRQRAEGTFYTELIERLNKVLMFSHPDLILEVKEVTSLGRDPSLARDEVRIQLRLELRPLYSHPIGSSNAAEGLRPGENPLFAHREA